MLAERYTHSVRALWQCHCSFAGTKKYQRTDKGPKAAEAWIRPDELGTNTAQVVINVIETNLRVVAENTITIDIHFFGLSLLEHCVDLLRTSTYWRFELATWFQCSRMFSVAVHQWGLEYAIVTLFITTKLHIGAVQILLNFLLANSM